MGGLECLRAMRGDARLSRIPVLGLTGDGTDGALGQFRDAGADVVRSKPIDPQELVSIAWGFASRPGTGRGWESGAGSDRGGAREGERGDDGAAHSHDQAEIAGGGGGSRVEGMGERVGVVVTR